MFRRNRASGIVLSQKPGCYFWPFSEAQRACGQQKSRGLKSPGSHTVGADCSAPFVQPLCFCRTHSCSRRTRVRSRPYGCCPGGWWPEGFVAKVVRGIVIVLEVVVGTSVEDRGSGWQLPCCPPGGLPA